MYDLMYHAKAKKDMDSIAKYITDDLSNPKAANNLIIEMVNSANNLKGFPYINPVYIPYHPLKHEYRRLIVKNYIMFYYINEVKKLITIARVLYSGMDYNRFL